MGTWRKSTYSGASSGSCIEVAAWRKSSYSGASGGDCIEVAAWRKSSYSDASGGSCVEVAAADGVMIRDTTDRSGPVLKVGAAAWRRFIASAAGVAHGS